VAWQVVNDDACAPRMADFMALIFQSSSYIGREMNAQAAVEGLIVHAPVAELVDERMQQLVGD
jgi:hypothetical protein